MVPLSSSPSSHSEHRASFAQLSDWMWAWTHPYKLLKMLYESFGKPIDSHEIQGKLGINRNSLSGAVNTLRIRLKVNFPSNEYQVISDNGYGLYHISANGSTKAALPEWTRVKRQNSRWAAVDSTRQAVNTVVRTPVAKKTPPSSKGRWSGAQSVQSKAKGDVAQVLVAPSSSVTSPNARALWLYDPSSKVWQLYAILSKSVWQPVWADVVKALFPDAYQNMVNALGNLKERLSLHGFTIKKQKEKNRVLSYTLCLAWDGDVEENDAWEEVGEEVSIESVYSKKSLELFPTGRQKRIRYRYTFTRESKMSISLSDEKSGTKEQLTFTQDETYALWILSTLLSPASFEKWLLMPSLTLERLIGKEDIISQAIKVINKKLAPIGVQISTLDFEGKHFEKGGDFYLVIQ